MIPNFAARIRALEDERLEAFVKDWIDRRTRDYVETQRWSGPGDMGRDVVGSVEVAGLLQCDDADRLSDTPLRQSVYEVC